MKRTVGRPTRRAVVVGLVGVMAVLAGAASVAFAGERPELSMVRNATARFHDLSKADAEGYKKFYICTDNEGVGTMGQHFVNGSLVGDGVLDPTHPEALVYEPRANGGYKLVAAEYVEIAAVWEATHANPPQLFGHTLKKVPAPNRYGLPDFYEIHAWVWAPNPRGMFGRPRSRSPSAG